MSCTKNVFSWQWEQHAWQRQVTHTEVQPSHTTDQWGREVPVDYVICRTEYVCRDCGAIRDAGYCSCDPERAEKCAIRLMWLDEATV